MSAQIVGGRDFAALLEHELAILPSDEKTLIPLYEAYRAASAALMGILNMPRTSKDPAGIIEDEIQRMDDHACAIAVKLSHLSSIDSYWREMYLEQMLSHCFFTGGGYPDALEVIAKATALPVTERKIAY
jgi:hypothetical protein